MSILGLHHEGGHLQDEGQEVCFCQDGGLPTIPALGWDKAKVWVKAKVLPYH